MRKGDTLSAISRRFYDSARFWPALKDYNRDAFEETGGTLIPGMTLRVPPKEKL
ncbi:MAG: LysM peptidoglycan-binding domain-containing protein [Candidatus Pacebacteria bacterium]|nr:LysM peptidoglycan-binding domain-containing protein [Candidatus Paceibacterota bacterium]